MPDTRTPSYSELTAQAAEDGIQQLVVGAVVAHDDTVLLLKRPQGDFMGGIFELPSGKVEPNEPLDGALVREVKEETGLDVSEIGAYLGFFDYRSGSGKKSRQFTFVVTVAETAPVELTEHDDYLWAPVDEDPPVTEAVKRILAAYAELRWS